MSIDYSLSYIRGLHARSYILVVFSDCTFGVGKRLTFQLVRLRREIAEIRQLAELVPVSIGDNKAARHSETLQPGSQVWRFPDLPAPEPDLIRSGREPRPSRSRCRHGFGAEHAS